MKKGLIWFRVIFYSILLAGLALTLIVLLPGVISGNSDFHFSQLDGLKSFGGISLALIVSIFGLIRAIRQLNGEKPQERIEFTEKLNIHYTGKIEYKDYRNLIFSLSYKGPRYFIFILIFLIISQTFTGNID